MDSHTDSLNINKQTYTDRQIDQLVIKLNRQSNYRRHMKKEQKNKDKIKDNNNGSI